MPRSERQKTNFDRFYLGRIFKDSPLFRLFLVAAIGSSTSTTRAATNEVALIQLNQLFKQSGILIDNSDPMSPFDSNGNFDPSLVKPETRERPQQSEVFRPREFNLTTDEVRQFTEQFGVDGMTNPGAFIVTASIQRTADQTPVYTLNARLPAGESGQYATVGVNSAMSLLAAEQQSVTVELVFDLSPKQDGATVIIQLKVADSLHTVAENGEGQTQPFTFPEGSTFNGWSPDTGEIESYFIPFPVVAKNQSEMIVPENATPSSETTIIRVNSENIDYLKQAVTQSGHPDYQTFFQAGEPLVAITTNWTTADGSTYLLGFFGNGQIYWLTDLDQQNAEGQFQVSAESTPAVPNSALQSVLFVEGNTGAAESAHNARYASDPAYQTAFDRLPKTQQQKVLAGQAEYLGANGWKETTTQNGATVEAIFWEGISKNPENSVVVEEKDAAYIYQGADGYTLSMTSWLNRQASLERVGHQYDRITKAENSDQGFAEMAKLMKSLGVASGSSLQVVFLSEFDLKNSANGVVVTNSRYSDVDLSYKLIELSTDKYVLFMAVNGPAVTDAEANATVGISYAWAQIAQHAVDDKLAKSDPSEWWDTKKLTQNRRVIKSLAKFNTDYVVLKLSKSQ